MRQAGSPESLEFPIRANHATKFEGHSGKIQPPKVCVGVLRLLLIIAKLPLALLRLFTGYSLSRLFVLGYRFFDDLYLF